jgi:hypothetical protein
VDGYSKAIQLAPSVISYYYNRGPAYQQQQEKDLAIADFKTVIESSTNESLKQQAKQMRQELGAQ